MKKRIIAAVLAASMAFSMPIGAMAASKPGSVSTLAQMEETNATQQVQPLGIKEFHSHSALRLCILGAAFIAAFVLDVNVIYIILATALVGVISALAARKRGGAK